MTFLCKCVLLWKCEVELSATRRNMTLNEGNLLSPHGPVTLFPHSVFPQALIQDAAVMMEGGTGLPGTSRTRRAQIKATHCPQKFFLHGFGVCVKGNGRERKAHKSTKEGRDSLGPATGFDLPPLNGHCKLVGPLYQIAFCYFAQTLLCEKRHVASHLSFCLFLTKHKWKFKWDPKEYMHKKQLSVTNSVRYGWLQ